MQIQGHVIAVCSWSLQPADTNDLIRQVRQAGLHHVQLALGPLLELSAEDRHRANQALVAAGIGITGGMIDFHGEDYSSIDAIRRTGGFLPDALWPDRRQRAAAAARLGATLGIQSITTHIGFVPPRSSPSYQAMLGRIQDVAADFASVGVDLLMETGQEPASELAAFLSDLGASNVHINFDPANMILYGAGAPIEAIGVVGPHIRHVHAKDATASTQPGRTWGAEVAFGTGQVGPSAFSGALKRAGYSGPIAIEREAGTQRMADVKAAIEALRAIGEVS